jgi:hypothetical protein
MGSIPYALSVHHFISSVGADAGFASIIGLAILILLYFAQARETSSLRSYAWDAAERIEQLEARIAQLVRAQSSAPQVTNAPVAPAPRGFVTANTSAGAISASRGAFAQPPAAPGSIPIAPAGVGAPALAAATKLIPTPVPPPAQEPAAAPVPAAAGVGAAGAVALASDQPPDATVIGAPVTVAGGAPPASNGTTTYPPVPAPRAGGPAAPSPRVQLRSGGAVPPPGRRPGGSAAGRGVPPRRGDAGRSGGRGRRIVGILAALLVIAAVVLVLVFVIGGAKSNKTNSSSASNATGQTSTGGRGRTARKAIINPSVVNVAVLNGTDTNGLAETVANRLKAIGYRAGQGQGVVTDAAVQTHQTTIVAYEPGFKTDALAVAQSLKLPRSSVQPVDQEAQQVCTSQGACAANVVLTVGADLSTGQ